MAKKSAKSNSSVDAATPVAVAATTRSTDKAKASKSSVGAPSQHKQTSRKGKKAWRKNVNIEEVEHGLEEMRSEERVVGTALQNLKDSDLFEVDVKGDDKIRHIAPKFSSSQLTSAKILAQRSAVPAVFSRPSSSTSSGKRKAGTLSREEKERLLKIAKRQRKGPFGAVMDPSEYTSGGGAVELSTAVKESGSYDPWSAGDEDDMEVDMGLETVQPKKVKPPPTAKPKDGIEVAAVVEPHQGMSYNPPVEAHTELIHKAAEVEQRKLDELARMAETKKKMDAAKMDADDGYVFGMPAGMTVDVPTEEDGDEDEVELEEDGEKPVKKQPKPKTKQQRQKAAKMLAEKRALAAVAARKKQLAIIEQAKGLRRANTRQTTAQGRAVEEKQLQLQLKLKQAGLAGQKLGKHKVPEAPVEVQIGEDLSENLRGLKPEGNLFRDRFMSLQQRALIEPRVRVLPKRRTHKIVEYEKHAWKKFDRE